MFLTTKLNSKNYLLYIFSISVDVNYMNGVSYVKSKRGGYHILYDGYTFTPNDKPFPGQKSRNWKCTMYYKLKCRARIVTYDSPNGTTLRLGHIGHTHDRIIPELNNATNVHRWFIN